MIKSKQKKVLMIIVLAILIIAVSISIFLGVSMYQQNQTPKMSFNEMLQYTVKNKEDAVITIGIIKNGEVSYKIYGNNGVELEQKQHTYEIGSMTKTVTATLIYKAISEVKLNIDDRIDKYLTLPQKDYYPTIKRLLTHTSGYKSHYFESEMFGNFFSGKNDFYGISTEKMISRIGKINSKDKDYKFEYSNFGFSVLGIVLSKAYGIEYEQLVNAYLQDLGLTDTKISDGQGDLGKYWDWEKNDAYLAAGGLTSNIDNMLKYAALQLNQNDSYFTATHNKLADITNNSETNKKLNIHMDYIGAAWIGDIENSLIWHNGGTGNYNSYIGFDMKKQLAVVVLSNLAPNFRLPATVMGIKLLTNLQSEEDFAKLM